MFSMSSRKFQKMDDEGVGICIGCKAKRKQCEPDARNYECNKCKKRLVFGASELLMMGKIDITG